MVVGLKVFKVFVDETTENCYANYKVNRNFIYLITKSRRKLVRNMAKAVRAAAGVVAEHAVGGNGIVVEAAPFPFPRVWQGRKA